MPVIKMYTSASCSYCIRAKQLLEKYGVKDGDIEEIRIDLDTQGRDAMMKSTGRRTVPQIYIGETHVGGYDDLAMLESEGKLKPMLTA